MRVDFLVCDPEGMPRFALEYQGGYHKDGKQQAKDKFKECVITEAGLCLQQIDSKTLNALEKGQESI